MADYIQRQIDMIGEAMIALAKKLGIYRGGEGGLELEKIEATAMEGEPSVDIGDILRQDDPVGYMADTLMYSDEAIETFVEIIMKSDADEQTRLKLLHDAVAHMERQGKYSFVLHRYML